MSLFGESACHVHCDVTQHSIRLPRAERMISLVIPLFNEQQNVHSLYRRVTDAAAVWGEDYEVVVIDDGSRDATPELLTSICREDQRWRVLSFSRNFGHQAAVSAGLEHAHGDVVAVMDGDLQDPPEVLSGMLQKWREGFHVVYAVRRCRKENILKRAAYGAFYRLMRQVASIDVPLDAGDFCVMDRVVVDVLRTLPERSRFVRGLRSWVGFRQIGFEYERHARQSGESKYTLRKLLGLAASGIVSFSSLPLRVASWIGMSLCLLSFVLIGLLAAWWATDLRVAGIHPANAVGWTSLISVILLVAGLQMLMTGFVGEYIARIFDEVKGRPGWVIARAVNFDYPVAPSDPLARNPAALMHTMLNPSATVSRDELER